MKKASIYPKIIVLLWIYFFLGVTVSFVTPLNEAPDEADHFLFVKYLLENGRLPVMHPIASKNETMEANQPPLFYALNAGFLQLAGVTEMSQPVHQPINQCFSFDVQDEGRPTFYLHSTAELPPYSGTYLAYHLARLLSVLMGLLTVALAFGLMRLLGGSVSLATLAAALVGFNPQFVFISASVNNDVPVALLGAAVVAACAAAWQKPTHSRYALLGLLLGFGFLTKFALFAFWLIACLSAMSKEQWARNKEQGAKNKEQNQGRFLGFMPNVGVLFSRLALVLLLPVLVSGWLYWRNGQLYGDPLVWEVHLLAKGDQVLRQGNLDIADLLHFVSFHFRSFWGLFGWLRISLTWPQYLIYTLVVLAGVAGWVKGWRDVPAGRRVSWVMVLLAIAAVYASLLRYILTINWSGYQGRLAFAAIVPIALVLARGWRTWFRGVRSQLVAVSFLCLLSLFSLVLLGRFFSDGDYLALDEKLAVHSFCAPYNDGDWYVAGHWPAVVSATAAELPVTLFAQANVVPPSIRQEWQPKELLLLDGKGQILATVDAHAKNLSVADVSRPMQAFLALESEVGISKDGVRATNIYQQPFVIGEVLFPSAPPDLTGFTAVSHNFGDTLKLVGYQAEQAGDELIVRLAWEAIAPPPVAYTTFVHLLDAQGNIATQADSQPLDGRYPTDVWQVGEVVVEEKRLPLPLEGQGFVTAVGAYHLESNTQLGTRLTLE